MSDRCLTGDTAAGVSFLLLSVANVSGLVKFWVFSGALVVESDCGEGFLEMYGLAGNFLVAAFSTYNVSLSDNFGFSGIRHLIWLSDA